MRKTKKADRFAGAKSHKRKDKQTFLTAQDSIPFEYMTDDGIASLGNQEYSATFLLTDINYMKTAEEIRIGIFEKFCMFLNAFTPDLRLQVHIRVKRMDRDVKNLAIPETGEPGPLLTGKQEYNAILDHRINGEDAYIQQKYLTVTVIADSIQRAEKTLDHVENDVLHNLHDITGCRTYRLDKCKRLSLLKEIYRPNDDTPITPEMFAESGLGEKDVIAPYGFDTTDETTVKLGDEYTKVLFLTDFPQELPDDIIRVTADCKEDLLITLNIRPQDPKKAMDDTKKRLRALDKEEADSHSRQAKATGGLTIPRTPRDLAKAIQNAEAFLHDLQSRNEKMFINSIFVVVHGPSMDYVSSVKEEIEKNIVQTGCDIKPMRFDVENGLNSALPLGRNDTFVARTFTTTSTAVFIPFNVSEILQPTGLLYGRNSQSRNLLLLDRKTLNNPHGLYCGTSGAGKSFGAKWEVLECFFRTDDDILLIDPDGEMSKVTSLLNGTEIALSNNSRLRFNPLDINEFYGGEEEDNPIPFKSDFIISLMDVILGGKQGVDPVLRSVIDHCVREIYKPWLQSPTSENIPTLPDFYRVLGAQPEEQARYLHSALEIYVEGSLNIFSEHTNVALDNRMISFNTKRVGKQMKDLAMAIIQDFCWNQISSNQEQKKNTWLWNDEIHTSLRSPNTAAWVIDSWKRGRKYGLIATGMTQEVGDMMKSEDARSLLANSEFVMMYRITRDMIDDIGKVMSLSDSQMAHLLGCQSGCGLMKAGNSIVEFDNRIPEKGVLFDALMTTIKKDDSRA